MDYDYKQIRRRYSDYTLEEIGKKFGVTKQAVCKYEKFSMPDDVKIFYLSLRNNDKDKIIIEYLKNEINRKNKNRERRK